MSPLSHKHIASFSALMMFAPLIKHQISQFDLSSSDQQFVVSYIRVGIIVIILILISFVVLLIWNKWNLVYTDVISQICMWLWLILMIWGSIAILQDKVLLAMSDVWPQSLDNHKIENNADILVILPGYNIYLRYTHHRDYIIQESILVWSVYMMMWRLIPSTWTIVLGLIWIAVRTFYRFAYPISSNKITTWISESRLTNPEEIYAYISAWMIYSVKYLSSLITRNKLSISYWQYRAYDQSIYRQLHSRGDNYGLMAEYVILWLLIATSIVSSFAIYQYTLWYGLGLIPQLFVLCRYMLMFYVGQFVYIPIIHEIVWLIITLFHYIYNTHDDP